MDIIYWKYIGYIGYIIFDMYKMNIWREQGKPWHIVYSNTVHAKQQQQQEHYI